MLDTSGTGMSLCVAEYEASSCHPFDSRFCPVTSIVLKYSVALGSPTSVFNWYCTGLYASGYSHHVSVLARIVSRSHLAVGSRVRSVVRNRVDLRASQQILLPQDIESSRVQSRHAKRKVLEQRAFERERVLIFLFRQVLEEKLALLVRLGRRHERDVHPAELVHLRVVDLGEDDLVLEPQGVVAAAVEGVRGHAAEVAHAGQGHVEEPVARTRTCGRRAGSPWPRWACPGAA